MDDFGFVVFMDVQKTGSTFISQVLKDVLGSDASRGLVKHGRVRKRREDTLYFASVRHPFETWHSLFRYGCDRKGSLARRLRQQGLGHLYEPSGEGFARWLDFVLDEANAPLLKEGYDKVRADLFGFQTFRFLVLSLANPVQRLAGVQTVEELDALYEGQAITSFVVRNEHMSEDLMRLFREHLADQVDLDKAAAVLDSAPRINVSKTDRLAASLAPPVLERMRRKEDFLLRRFYPDSVVNDVATVR